MRMVLQIVVGIGFCGLSVAGASPMPIQAYDATGATRGTALGDLNIGREFTVSGTGINVSALGVYDDAGHVLFNSHDITLFSINQFTPTITAVPITTVNVPAGGSSPSDFVFATLPGTLHLAPGIYGIIAYGMNSAVDGNNIPIGDSYGDHGGTPNGVLTPNVADDQYAGSRFDPFAFPNPYVGSPNYPQGGDGGDHSSVSFLYTVPEPGTIGLIALGAVGFLARRRM